MNMLQTSDVILLIGMAITLIAVFILSRMGFDKITPQLTEIQRNISNLTLPTENQALNVVTDERKRKFLDQHNIILHYINKVKFRQFYNEQFKQSLSLDSLTDETTKEIQSNLGSNLGGVIESGIGGKSTQKLTSNFSINYDDVLLSLFLRYQTATLQNNLVTLGIEDIEYPDFQNLSSAFKQKPEIAVTQLPEKIVEHVISNIQKTERLVLMEGYFDVTKEGENYRYTYKHPVNTYILDTKKHITISFLVPSNKLAPEIAPYYEKNTTMKIAVFGYVLQYINGEKGIWDLQLIPIAVY